MKYNKYFTPTQVMISQKQQPQDHDQEQQDTSIPETINQTPNKIK